MLGSCLVATEGTMNKTVGFLLATIVAVGAIMFAIWQTGRVGEEARFKAEALAASKATEGMFKSTQAQLTKLRQEKEAAESAAKTENDQLRKERQAAESAANSARDQVKALETAKAAAEQAKVAAEDALAKERAAREAAERALADAKTQ
jgi:hypothetical protein